MTMAYICDGNRRGGKVLVKGCYRYHKNKETSTAIYWRCWKQMCRARLQTNVFDMRDANPNIQVTKEASHNHEGDEDVIKPALFLSELKNEIKKNPSTTIRRVYNAGLVRKAQRGFRREFIPDFQSVRSVLARARRKVMPAIPHTLQDVVLEGQWKMTWSEHNFVLDQNEEWGTLTFGTNENLRRLNECHDVFMDGTFQTCPPPYKQIFTIHGKYKTRVLPFVVSLMTNQSLGAYRYVLKIIKTAMRTENGHRWRPWRVICDFEYSLVTAVQAELTHTQVQGCYFHFTQNLWKRIQYVGLAGRYNRHLRLRKCIRKFMAIAYLPLALVRNNFHALANAPCTLRTIRRYSQVRDFIEYMEDQYINGNFPPAMWNVYQRDMDNRTNNHVEAFHYTWKRAVSERHPSLWVFIRHLKDLQSNIEVTADAADNGEPRPVRRLKWRRLEERITKLKNEYNNGERDLNSYWEAVAHCTAQFR